MPAKTIDGPVGSYMLILPVIARGRENKASKVSIITTSTDWQTLSESHVESSPQSHKSK